MLSLIPFSRFLPHNYACANSLFLAKRNVFVEQVTFSTSESNCFWKTKKHDSNRIFKIKLMLPWEISKFWLQQQLFAKKNFCMEKTLCNIFKTVYAVKINGPVFGRCNIVPIRKRGLEFQVSSYSQIIQKIAIFSLQ